VVPTADSTSDGSRTCGWIWKGRGEPKRYTWKSRWSAVNTRSVSRSSARTTRVASASSIGRS